MGWTVLEEKYSTEIPEMGNSGPITEVVLLLRWSYY